MPLLQLLSRLTSTVAVSRVSTLVNTRKRSLNVVNTLNLFRGRHMLTVRLGGLHDRFNLPLPRPPQAGRLIMSQSGVEAAPSGKKNREMLVWRVLAKKFFIYEIRFLCVELLSNVSQTIFHTPLISSLTRRSLAVIH